MVIFTSFLVYILDSIFLLYDFSCFSPSASTLALYSCSILSLNKTQSLQKKSKIETSGQEKTESLPENLGFLTTSFSTWTPRPGSTYRSLGLQGSLLRRKNAMGKTIQSFKLLYKLLFVKTSVPVNVKSFKDVLCLLKGRLSRLTL